MKARVYNYECIHSHKDGHRMVFRWPHGIEMLIDFPLGKGYILNRGDKRDEFPLQMPIAELEQKIDFCQDADDAVAPFCGMTREQLTEMCKAAISLEDLADYIMDDKGRKQMEFVIAVGGGELIITGTYVLKYEYSRHDDPERINPPEYRISFFEFYLEDDLKIEYFRDGYDEEGFDLTTDIALDEEALEDIIHNKAKE